jgi:hypothetical protein
VTGGAVLAVNNFGDTRSDGLAGPMALLIILLLAVATVLLIRNMNARLRRLPDQFPGQDGFKQDGAGQDGAGQDSPDGGGDRTEQTDRPGTPTSM